VYLGAHASTDGNYIICARCIFLFDVTGFTGNSDDITGITLNLNVSTSVDDLAITNFSIVGSTPANNNGLVTADYGQLGTTKLSGDVALVGTGYKSISLNATGIAAVKTAIAGDKIVKLGARLNADGLSGSITWGASKISGNKVYMADNGTNKPYLEITYSTNETFNRALSDSMMNAASRLATVIRTGQFTRALSDSILNAASRLATVARAFVFYRNLTDNISVSASVTKLMSYSRSLSVLIMNGASRFVSLSLWQKLLTKMGIRQSNNIGSKSQQNKGTRQSNNIGKKN
jgi:hypothetical protein